MRRMLFCLFLFAGMLLGSIPALAANTATKKKANSTQNAAPVPPTPGDIVAEFVGCYFTRGRDICTFSEPDGNDFAILLCDNDDKYDLCGDIGTSRSTFNPYDAHDREQNLGRQFIITPKKTIEKEKNGILCIDWLRPSAIRLDTRHGVPRNTQVLPYQTLEGTVKCVEEPMFQVYFTDTKHKRYVLHKKMFYGTGADFMATFCPDSPSYQGDGRRGPYRLQGEIVFKGIEPGIPTFELVRPVLKKNLKGRWKEVRPPGY